MTGRARRVRGRVGEGTTHRRQTQWGIHHQGEQEGSSGQSESEDRVGLGGVGRLLRGRGTLSRSPSVRCARIGTDRRMRRVSSVSISACIRACVHVQRGYGG